MAALRSIDAEAPEPQEGRQGTPGLAPVAPTAPHTRRPLDDVAALLDGDQPLPLLGLVSSLLATLDPPGPALPIAAGEETEMPWREDVAQALLGAPALETWPC